MTPAGTSNELDVQNGWEENTHTAYTSVYHFHMTRIMRGTYRYIALGITFPLMSSSLWVVHKVDSGLLSGVS